MAAIEYILILLGAVLISNYISVQFPRISTPLVQIGAGVALTLLPVSFEIDLDPELFMVLFIAPLLFEDAKVMDKPSLWRLKYPILLLALGLVFLTVVILGFTVHLFEPSIPLAAAFALAAALAPTDAVSVASLKQNANISSEQSLLLQGESLLNDASALVSFHFAIVAVLTGGFSLINAGGDFLFRFFGGLALGLGLMLVRYGSLRWLRSRGMNSVAFHTLAEVITPFLMYLIAEALGVSGVITVVAAGIAHSFAPRVVTPSSARLNIVTNSVWSVLSFALNGLVFLMLGTQLPYIIKDLWAGTVEHSFFLIAFVILILLVIMAIRFSWVLFMHRNVDLRSGTQAGSRGKEEPMPLHEVGERSRPDLSDLSDGFGIMSSEERSAAVEHYVAMQREQFKEERAGRRQARGATKRAEKQAARADADYWRLHLYDALLLSLTGVKGAITLAVMLSTPILLSPGTPFPQRDLLLFLASGVILLSLLTANIVVPLIAPRKKLAPQPAAELDATLDIWRHVIAGLSAQAEPGERIATSEVIKQYYNRISTLKEYNAIENPNEQHVRRYVIEMELDNTLRLIDEGKVSNYTALIYVNMLSNQLAHSEHHSSVRWRLKALFEASKHQWKTWRGARKSQKEYRQLSDERRTLRFFEFRALQLANYRNVIEKMHALAPTEELPARTVDLVRLELEQRVARLENRSSSSGPVAAMRGGRSDQLIIEARALDLERQAINEALEAGSISGETAKMLRDNVAIMELDIEDELE